MHGIQGGEKHEIAHLLLLWKTVVLSLLQLALELRHALLQGAPLLLTELQQALELQDGSLQGIYCWLLLLPLLRLEHAHASLQLVPLCRHLQSTEMSGQLKPCLSGRLMFHDARRP